MTDRPNERQPSSHLRQESPADARVTRDSTVRLCRPLGNKSKRSRKPHPRTKHHVDRQIGGEVMAILYIQDGRRPPKVAQLDRSTPKTLPYLTKYHVCMLYTAGDMLV